MQFTNGDPVLVKSGEHAGLVGTIGARYPDGGNEVLFTDSGIEVILPDSDLELFVDSGTGADDILASPFDNVRHDGRAEGPTSVTASEAHLMLSRQIGLASRCALGDGLTRAEVAQALRDEAYAIETEDVAEDMSPITFHMA